MTRSDVHKLVDELPDDKVEGAGQLIRLVNAGQLDPDHAWFWTGEWQEGEREVDEEIRSGRSIRFESDEAFIAHLEHVPPADAT